MRLGSSSSGAWLESGEEYNVLCCSKHDHILISGGHASASGRLFVLCLNSGSKGFHFSLLSGLFLRKCQQMFVVSTSVCVRPSSAFSLIIKYVKLQQKFLFGRLICSSAACSLTTSFSVAFFILPPCQTSALHSQHFSAQHPHCPSCTLIPLHLL